MASKPNSKRRIALKLRCPVCGRSNVEIIEGSLHMYARCRFCGHMWDLGLKDKARF